MNESAHDAEEPTRTHRLQVGAARVATSTPARVEPVKLTSATSGCALRCGPTSGPRPCTMLNTPGGTPASCTASQNSRADVGVYSDGWRARVSGAAGAEGRTLRTMVQPAAMAAPTLSEICDTGQFQGVIMAATPMGSYTTLHGV